jgi:prepilin-type processing-associated H-X9-DG protein
MTPPNDQNAPGQDTLRAYLLDTLSERERRRVDVWLEADPKAGETLERERVSMARLGLLPDRDPPEALADRTLNAVRQAENTRPRRRFNIRPYVAPVVAVLLVVFVGWNLLMTSVTPARESARRASCQNNLKQMALVLQLYAADNDGHYPPLAPYRDLWVPDLRVLYPEYLTDPEIFSCPSSVSMDKTPEGGWNPKTEGEWRAFHEALAKDYIYLGYTTRNAEDLEALGKSRRSAFADSPDLPLLNNRSLSPEETARIPIVFDRIAEVGDTIFSNHVPIGANVAFLDGHIEFQRYTPDGFPISPAAIKALGLTVPNP